MDFNATSHGQRDIDDSDYVGLPRKVIFASADELKLPAAVPHQTKDSHYVEVAVLQLAWWNLFGGPAWNDPECNWRHKSISANATMNRPDGLIRSICHNQCADSAIWYPRSYRRIVANH